MAKESEVLEARLPDAAPKASRPGATPAASPVNANHDTSALGVTIEQKLLFTVLSPMFGGK